MKNLATISFVTVLGFLSAACSETAEEKAARTAREFCIAMGNQMASPAEKADKERFQRSMDDCIAHTTNENLRRLKSQ